MEYSSRPLTRQLGKDGPMIPAIGFGLMGMSIGYGSASSDNERLRVLDRAWEIGCTNWDTANIYGDNEDIIGKWFKQHPERRKDIFLATKFGLKAGVEGITTDSSPGYCRKCIDQSLKRLGIDQIDLYYLHRADINIPIEETVQAMSQIVKEGKVKFLGLSEVSSTTLRRAHAIHPISAVQVEYNPWTLDIEGESGTYLLETSKELGVSIFAYSPLGRGIMTGKYRSTSDFGEGDARASMVRFQGQNFENNLKLVDKLAELAKEKQCLPGQLALTWIMAQGDNIFVIPGTKKTKYLEENFGASWIKITEVESQRVRKLASAADVSGGRDATFGAYVDTAPLLT